MQELNLPTGIYPAKQSEWKTLADVTAKAFARDPVNTWIFGKERAIASCFRVLAREIYSCYGHCHFAGLPGDPPKGATMWLHSDQTPRLSRRAQLALGIGVYRHGKKGALDRATTAGEIMEKHHPREPHMYLFTIGVLPSARGTGLGHALLAPMLDACDRKGLPCYLENSNPDNFGFYSSHGFEHMDQFAAGDGGPPLQAMWRRSSLT